MAFQRVHTASADGTFSSSGAAAWNAAHGVSGATVGGIPYCPTATSEATSLNLTFDGTNLTVGGVVFAANGTTALPSLSFTNHTGDGLSSDGSMHLSVTGVEVFRWGAANTSHLSIVPTFWVFSDTALLKMGAGGDFGFSRTGAGTGAIGTGATGSFAGRLKLTSTITAAVAVGSLNASPTIGEVQTVNDALAVTIKGATVANGGSAVCQVMWNGSNWVGI